MEDKKLFCEKLGELLRDYAPRLDVKDIDYIVLKDGRQIACVRFKNGKLAPADVTADNCLMVMYDICKALM